MLLNRSFSRRIGKTLSSSQKTLLEQRLPQHLFTGGKLPLDKELVLEVGFGMGEHFVHQAKLNQDKLFIGSEVYLNGVANVLKLAEEQDVYNFLLWPDDLDLIIKQIPDNSLSAVYILFPDPWPKRKQYKKRIFNHLRLELFSSKLQDGGVIIFASDIQDYFQASKELIKNSGCFEVISEIGHENYIPTKYHRKALAAGRGASFFSAKK